MPLFQSNTYVRDNLQTPAPPTKTPQTFGSSILYHCPFQYSNCSGRRKALLIGIDYFGQRGKLQGCIEAVNNMSAFLSQNFGFHRDDMVILTDDQKRPKSQPTKRNILCAMHWLVKDARPNDSLLFHYSGNTSCFLYWYRWPFLGHGSLVEDPSGDGKSDDEVMYPFDFRQVGHIGYDEMHRIMVQPLQPGVRLTTIFDSCHFCGIWDIWPVYIAHAEWSLD